MFASLEHLTKTYPHPQRPVVALQDLSLNLQAGDFLAVCGKSGCGKTTLLLTLGGLLRPDSGRVVVQGTDLYQLPANRRAAFRARHIAFVFQQFHLVPYLSVVDNVLAAALGLDNGSHAGTRERAEQLVEEFGLSERRSHRPGQLSTGERQRTALARALLNSPQLLLADEPTGNLDQENGALVLDRLAQFAAAGGAVLLVTHDRSAAQRADRIIRLEQGQMVVREEGVGGEGKRRKRRKRRLNRGAAGSAETSEIDRAAIWASFVRGTNDAQIAARSAANSALPAAPRFNLLSSPSSLLFPLPPSPAHKPHNPPAAAIESGETPSSANRRSTSVRPTVSRSRRSA